MNIFAAIVELCCTILDAAAAAQQAADISARLHTWRSVITRPPALDTPIPLTPSEPTPAPAPLILTIRQSRALQLARQYGRVTNNTLLGAFPLNHPETIRLDLKGLTTLGLLQRHGKNSGTYYTLPPPRD